MKKTKLISIFIALLLLITSCGVTSEDAITENKGEDAQTENKEEIKETDEAETKTDDADTETKEEDVSESSELKTFTASSTGYNGEIKIEADIKGKEIVDVRVIEDNESSPVKKRAFPLIIERILQEQTPDVDSVSGASFTSHAIKTAVADALVQAGNDKIDLKFTFYEPYEGKEKAEDISTKMLVVGGGPAGLSAAIEAVQNGVDAKDIIVVEKMDILGGNGKFDMVLFNHINTEAQRKAGIEDSKEKLLEDRKEGAWDTEERLIAEVEGAEKLDEWLRDMGIELNYVYDNRTHMAEKDGYAGEELMDGIEKKIEELGIEVRTGTQADDLIIEDGKLAGVHVKNRKENYNILSDITVIATGGFSNNQELLNKYTEEGTERLNTSNQIGASGDMIPLFEKHGIQLGHMDKTVIFTYMISKGRELTGERVAPQAFDYMHVNSDGERFTNEQNTYTLERALANLDQPDGKTYMIFDQELRDFSYRLGKHVDDGLVEKGETIEELAQKLDINEEKLVETLETYNKVASGEGNDQFRDEKPSRPLKAPFYGMQIEAAIHMTKGGVVCNEKAQILDNDGKVVPGAYAAGEVTDTSGIYSQAFIFGRIAGNEAAKELTGAE